MLENGHVAPRRSDNVFHDIMAAIHMSDAGKLTVVTLRSVIPKMMMVLYLPKEQWQQREKGEERWEGGYWGMCMFFHDVSHGVH